jgi:tRNA(Ile)-lysidine synthase
MQKEFLEFINRNGLCKASDRILVAVSGGKDSMALLHLFHEGGFDVSVAHFNFGLRGEASDGDEEFVRQCCTDRDIPFFSNKADTKKTAKDLGISTQMAARELRYSWFEDLINEHSFEFLATAHHLDDRIETLYLNITKGTGPKGLRSIPLTKGKIIRPLLFAKASQIIDYLREKKLVWREDTSNQTVDYQRNKIRHQVIPVLRELNPGLENTLLTNFSRFEALHDIFEEKLNAFKISVEFGEIIKIPFADWRESPGFTLVLEEFLKPYGFNYQEVTSLLKIDLVGKKIVSASHTITLGRGEWLLEKSTPPESESYVFHAPGVYEIGQRKIRISTITDFPSIMEIRNGEQAFFDLDTISWPLTLRNWKEGDKFQPFGMEGKKLVSDFLIDAKIDIPRKKKQLVLTDLNNILWVLGLRTDDRNKLNSATKSILKVSFF